MALVLLTLVPLVAVSSDAQVDLAKALVGRWEGEVRILGVKGNPDPNRTLIIESVEQKEGKWVGAGTFGVTGKRLGHVAIEVNADGGKPWIRFATEAGVTVRLELIDEQHLGGTLAARGAGTRGSDDRAMTLEKKK